jgi:2-keto-myo-inositol isomerase
MKMKIGFNEATTLKNSTLEKDLILAEKYGYDYIEVRFDKLREYLKTHKLGELKAYFDSHRIKPYALNALEFINFRSSEDYAKIKSDLVWLCEAGRAIGCGKLVVVPTFGISGVTKEQVKTETVRVLRELADIAAPYGMKLAFEFVGYPDCSVNNFADAYDIVCAAGRSNVGCVLDCFHFYAMGSKLSDLEKADGKKIFIFHIDDAEDMPVGTMTDANRLWPGDGVIPLGKMIEILRGIGFDEMASVEIFRPEYWQWDAEKTIAKGYETTEKVLKAANAR